MALTAPGYSAPTQTATPTRQVTYQPKRKFGYAAPGSLAPSAPQAPRVPGYTPRNISIPEIGQQIGQAYNRLPEPGPGQYRSTDGSIHNFPQGYTPQDIPGPQGVGDYKYVQRLNETKARGGAMTIEALQRAAANQQRLLGQETAGRLGIDPFGGRPITRGELGMAQVGEYARQEGLAEQDLSRGVDYLTQGRGAIGSDPGSILALEIAMRRAREGGQFGDQYLDQQRGLIRNRGAIAAQSGERRLAEDLARRGLAGPLAGLQQAELAQQNALGVQGQLAEFEQQAAAAREEAERAALGQLNDISYQQQQSRAAFDQALANAYLQNERAPIDYSPMLMNIKKKKQVAGGKAPSAQDIGRR